MKKLNFGCGPEIKDGWDNCDIQKHKKIIYCDANKFPYPFNDNTYDYILAREVLELLEDLPKVLSELWRISKPNAQIRIIVPYYNNKGAHNDLSVKHYFSDSSFKVFIDKPCFINKSRDFEIYSLKLIPSKIGRFFPKNIREKLALFIGGLISQVDVTLKINK